MHTKILMIVLLLGILVVGGFCLLPNQSEKILGSRSDSHIVTLREQFLQF